MKQLPKAFLQKQLGYFIYDLLNTKERIIEEAFVEKHINQSVPFNEELLSNFEDWLVSLLDGLKEDYPKTLVITLDSDDIPSFTVVDGDLSNLNGVAPFLEDESELTEQALKLTNDKTVNWTYNQKELDLSLVQHIAFINLDY
jgi:hypothetical protein